MNAVLESNRGKLIIFAAVLICMALTNVVIGQAYPNEAWPDNSAVQTLNGTSDSRTGITYIPVGTGPGSNPPFSIQFDRNQQRSNAILGTANEGRAVKVTANTIGVFPLRCRISGTDHSFAGSASTSVSATTGTYYVYLTSNGSGGCTVNVVTSGTGWPADQGTYVPCAEVAVAGGAITAVLDVRNRLVFATQSTAGASSTGTDSDFYILDQDNASAGANADLRFNRGSTGPDAGLRWNESLDTLDFLLDVTGPTLGKARASTLESTVTTGTAPLTVASITKVTSLNADTVDGVGFTAPAAANGVAYSTSTSEAAFTAAASAGNVLYADGSGVPTWGTLGATSGVQAYDADLSSMAALSGTGVGMRTAADTWTLRSLAAGNSITVVNPDGVSGNPTISVSGATQYAVQVGSSAGALQSLSVGPDNTVLVGNTGTNPSFRTLVNADINTAAAILPSKLAAGSSAQVLIGDASGVPTYRSITGDLTLSNTGDLQIASGSINSSDLAGGIALSKLASGTSAQVIVANSSGVPTYRTMAGDGAIDNAGQFTLGLLDLARSSPDYTGSIPYADLSGATLRRYMAQHEPGGTSESVSSDQNNMAVTNWSPSGLMTVTLPTPEAGLSFTFIVLHTNGIKIQTGTTTLIRVGASTSTATTGYITATTVGHSVTLLCVSTSLSAFQWISVAREGSWTVS